MVRSRLAIPRFFAFGALGSIAALTACGGGGGSSAPPTSAQPPAPRVAASTIASVPSAVKAPASFRVTIPSASTATAHGVSRKIASISASTNGIVISLLKSDNAAAQAAPPAPGTFDVSSTSTLCTTDTSGNRTCTLQVSAPIGNDIYTIDTYANANGTGAKLGSGALRMTVLQNVANTASVTIGGALASLLLYAPSYYGASSVYLAAPGTQYASYYASSARLYVFGFDSFNNPIVVPDTYSTPIYLTFNLGTYSTVDAANYLTGTVNYAFPNGGVTTASTSIGNDTLQITSPNDVVTLNAVLFTGYTQSVYVTGTVGAPVASPTPFVSPSPMPSTAPTPVTPSNIQTQYVYVYGATPTPGPSPSPTPTPTPTPPIISWSGDSRVNSSGPSLTFTSPVDPYETLNISDSAIGYTGNLLVSTTCAAGSYNFSPALSTSSSAPTKLVFGNFFVTVTPTNSTGASFLPSPAPSPAPTANATPCTITATDQSVPAGTSTITIYMNAITGTVQ